MVDFEIIRTYDPKKLVILDSSNWDEKPGTIYIKVLVPGEDKPVEVALKKNQVNTLYFEDLDLYDKEGRTELPDGIYKVTIEGTEKNHLKYSSLRLLTDKLYAKCGEECDGISETVKIYSMDIDVYLRSSVAHLRLKNDVDKAKIFYYKALERYKHLSKCNLCK